MQFESNVCFSLVNFHCIFINYFISVTTEGFFFAFINKGVLTIMCMHVYDVGMDVYFHFVKNANKLYFLLLIYETWIIQYTISNP